MSLCLDKNIKVVKRALKVPKFSGKHTPVHNRVLFGLLCVQKLGAILLVCA